VNATINITVTCIVYGILLNIRILNFKSFFNLSQKNILSASSQRPIVILVEVKSHRLFFQLITLTKDADWNTVTTDVPPPCSVTSCKLPRKLICNKSQRKLKIYHTIYEYTCVPQFSSMVLHCYIRSNLYLWKCMVPLCCSISDSFQAYPLSVALLPGHSSAILGQKNYSELGLNLI